MRWMPEPERNLFRMSIIALCGLLLLIFTPDMGVWEGRLFPVVDQFAITGMTEDPTGGLLADVEFRKRRSCKFSDIDWYWRNGRFWVEAEIVFPEDAGRPPSSRPKGEFAARWLLDIPWAHHNAPMKVIARHRCHGPSLWETYTTLLDGSTKEVIE